MVYKELKWKDIGYVVFWIVLVFLMMLSSCNPCERLSRRCPPQVKDSIYYKEKIVYKDTTIYVPLPRDTVFMGPPELKISVVNGQLMMKKICKTYGIITACAWIENSQPYVYAHLNDTSYKVTIDSAIRSSEYWHERWRTEKTVVEVRYIPAFYTFTMWFFFITVMVVVGYVVIKLKLI